MTEHHGLDLAAIQKSLGNHSIFAPSGSHMWLLCSGSLIPNLLAKDNAGRDAAEGTAGHEIAEKWLNAIKDWRLPQNGEPIDFGEDEIDEVIDACRPGYLVGTIKKIVEPLETFDIKITDEMLMYVRQYVKWCCELPGAHFIETRVDFSDLTPIPNQRGTADHAACEPGILTVTDLKYGKGVAVSAAEYLDDPRAMINGQFNGNPQAMLYAYGFFREYDHIYDFQTIRIRIAQPRRESWEVWETTRDQLLAFARYVKIRAVDAWTPDAPRTPSLKGCMFCKVKGSCAALAAFTEDMYDGVFEPVEDVIDASYRVVDEGRAVALKERLDSGEPWKSLPNPQELSTAHMAKLLPMRKAIEKFFAAMEEELTFRAINGEKIPWHKLVDGREGKRTFVEPEEVATDLEFIGATEDDIYEKALRSPAQIQEKLRARYGLTKKNAEELLRPLVTRSPGRQTLVLESDKREEADSMADVFEPVESDEDL